MIIMTCLSCGASAEITALGEPIQVACNGCGKSDVSFNCPIIASPVMRNSDFGEEQKVSENEPFYGIHKHGRVWKLRVGDYPKVVVTSPKPGSKLKSRVKVENE